MKYTLHGSSTEEQRSQPAIFPKTLRAAGRAGSVVIARCGDTPPSPTIAEATVGRSPCPQPKSRAAASLGILRKALKFLPF